MRSAGNDTTGQHYACCNGDDDDDHHHHHHSHSHNHNHHAHAVPPQVEALVSGAVVHDDDDPALQLVRARPLGGSGEQCRVTCGLCDPDQLSNGLSE